MFFLCCLGFSLLLGETLVFGFVLVPLFSVGLDLDYNIACTAPTIFGWLSLFPSEGTDGLAFTLCPFSFFNYLVHPIERPYYLFDQFSTFCNYFNTILV